MSAVYLTIERASLLAKLPDWGIDISRVDAKAPAPKYAIATVYWLLNVFAADWATFRDQFFPLNRRKGVRCRHFTRACASYADSMYFRKEEHPDADLAFGEFWTDSIDHGFILMPARANDSIIPVYFEPQTSLRIYPKIEDVNLCEFLRF